MCQGRVSEAWADVRIEGPLAVPTLCHLVLLPACVRSKVSEAAADTEILGVPPAQAVTFKPPLVQVGERRGRARTEALVDSSEGNVGCHASWV